MQNTCHLLMIEPVHFGYNEATAVNNSFQQKSDINVQPFALTEFNKLVHLLRANKINITVVKDTTDSLTPDSIFPNNWISFDDEGRIFLYPMFAHNRRLERKHSVLEVIRQKFKVNTVIDLSHHEENGAFLEGTGSMVLDRVNKVAYACISPRTNESVLDDFCRITAYKPVSFKASGSDGVAIYHTNVMMCVADDYAVICLDAVTDKIDKEKLVTCLLYSGKEIIAISLEQLDHFAGNMLQVINSDKERLLIMSTQAFSSLSAAQVKALQQHNRIIHSSLDHIERAGGGSARCMLAEVFLPPQ